MELILVLRRSDKETCQGTKAARLRHLMCILTRLGVFEIPLASAGRLDGKWARNDL